MSNSVEYKVYCGAKSRCNNPNIKNYKYYGWRWIKFKFLSFEEFFEELWPRPSVYHSVDRINNNWHYEKWNVIWNTNKQQSNNRRNNVLYSHNWEIKTLKQWCEILSLRYWTVVQRINYCWWSIEEALKLNNSHIKKYKIKKYKNSNIVHKKHILIRLIFKTGLYSKKQLSIRYWYDSSMAGKIIRWEHWKDFIFWKSIVI